MAGGRPQRINDKNNNGNNGNNNNNNEDDKDDNNGNDIDRLYGGWPSKSQGVVPALKMPWFQVKGKGDGEGTREKLEGRKKDGRNQQRFARKGVGSKQGTGNTEKVKEIYEVGEQNGKDKMDEVLRRSNGHRICKGKGRDPFFQRSQNECSRESCVI